MGASVIVVGIVCMSILFSLIMHELGHYLAAVRCGVEVERFYIGLPIPTSKTFNIKWRGRNYSKKIFLPLSKTIGRIGGTELHVSAVLLGAAVHINDDIYDLNSMEYVPKLHKLFIIIAGPLMNVGVACMLFTAELFLQQSGGFSIPEALSLFVYSVSNTVNILLWHVPNMLIGSADAFRYLILGPVTMLYFLVPVGNTAFTSGNWIPFIHRIGLLNIGFAIWNMFPMLVIKNVQSDGLQMLTIMLEDWLQSNKTVLKLYVYFIVIFGLFLVGVIIKVIVFDFLHVPLPWL